MTLSRRRSSGFTLLELVLTLAMSVVLMVMIGGAINFYGRDMNVRDMDVRQTQLATAIMQMIEDDLRATLHLEPIDTSALEGLLQATAGEASGGGQQEDLSAAGIDSEDDFTDDSLLGDESLIADTSLDLASNPMVLQTPGLVGDQAQIQVDLSRLPRLEEYTQILDESAANLDDVPSDIKTVAYFVQPAGGIGTVQDKLTWLADPSGSTESNAMTGGLVRRSLDRAATAFAASSGNLTQLSQSGDILAPEVASIQFEYWDGITWLPAWSSDEYGELPMAIRIQLTLTDPNVSSNPQTQAAEPRVFMHIVRLPLARPIEEEEEDLTEAGL